MFTSLSIYFLMAFLIFWSYCGYLIALYILLLLEKRGEQKPKTTLYPKLSILIPCYNEEKLVKRKLSNLHQLDYPKDKLKIFFLDGCSEDATVEILKRETSNKKGMKVLETKRRGKINQINTILPRLDTDIVVCTDMDALLEKNVLKKLVSAFQQDDRVAVVGANVVPKNSSDLEARYWEDQNLLRILESKVHSSSIVAAPCYAFKRDLLNSFPEDCIADDIHVSFLANSQGRQVKYIVDAVTHETRVPTSLSQLITHKFRKGNAYQIELLRFFYMLPQMLPHWKMIFLTKFLQVILMPWVLIFFVLSSMSLILSGLTYLKIVVFCFVLLFFSLAITSILMSRERKFLFKSKWKRPLLSVFLITNIILFLNGVTFPFYSQTSKYPKLKS